MNPPSPKRCPFSALAGAPPGSITLHPLAHVPTTPTTRFNVDHHTIATLSAAASLATRTPDLTQDFYAELFTRHPHLRHLFAPDLSAQVRKFSDMLQALIQGLSDPHATRQKLAALGTLHREKGVTPDQYPIVCDVLLAVMRRRAGPDWTREMDAEMARALHLISALMLASADGPTTPQPSTWPPATPAPPASPPPPSTG